MKCVLKICDYVGHISMGYDKIILIILLKKTQMCRREQYVRRHLFAMAFMLITAMLLSASLMRDAYLRDALAGKLDGLR